MPKTFAEVEELKRQWKDDPCWDLYETEGFEDHVEELKSFQEECEKVWSEKATLEEKQLDEAADKLGVRGLYRLLKEHQELLIRHNRALELLTDGEHDKAYKVLRGFQED